MRNICMKSILAAAVFTIMAIGLSGCAGKKDEKLPVVKLSIWWSDQGDWNLIEETIEAFEEEHADEAVFDISFLRRMS